MAQKKVRFAVVGAGNFGGSHMRGIVKNADVAEIDVLHFCISNHSGKRVNLQMFKKIHIKVHNIVHIEKS